MSGRLTSREYWDLGYRKEQIDPPLDIQSFRQHAQRRTIETLLDGVGNAKRIMEIGAGNSAVLSWLSRKYSERHWGGLDYSLDGCEKLRSRVAREGGAVEVVHADIFAPMPEQVGRWDAIYSLGVVEHFEDCSSVLKAMSTLLSSDGVIVTIVPNMAGLVGKLTRIWNRNVYDLHVPHTVDSLRNAHVEASLSIRSAGHLCSTNFGVLSACFPNNRGKGWKGYVWLSRLSTMLWRFESRWGDLPSSRWLSPYIYVVAEKSR
jgi:2-polyprenyl-3-methyl-5-hydroxy-6-metoxy-1,4-benzoquinol methylase